MIKLECPNARWLADIITAVHELVTEAVVVVDPQGLRLAAMDAGHVGLIHFDLPKVLFEEYEYTAEAPEVLFGLNWEDLQKVFTKAPEGESVQLTFKQPLEVHFPQHPARTFTVPLIDPTDLPQPSAFPDLTWPCEYQMDPQYLQHLIQTLTRFAEACEVEIRGDGDMFWRTVHPANEGPQAEIRIQANDFPVHRWEATLETVQAVFTLSYLNSSMKHLQKLGGDNSVTLRLGQDLPLKIDLSLRPITPPTGGGSIGWYIAPRIEEA